MTLGLGKILKEDMVGTSHKGKVIIFPTFQWKTGISRYLSKKRPAHGVRRV